MRLYFNAFLKFFFHVNENSGLLPSPCLADKDNYSLLQSLPVPNYIQRAFLAPILLLLNEKTAATYSRLKGSSL